MQGRSEQIRNNISGGSDSRRDRPSPTIPWIAETAGEWARGVARPKRSSSRLNARVAAKRKAVLVGPKPAVARGSRMEEGGQEGCFRSIVDSHARHEKARQRGGLPRMEDAVWSCSRTVTPTIRRTFSCWDAGRDANPPPTRQISDARRLLLQDRQTRREGQQLTVRAGVKSELRQTRSPNAPSNSFDRRERAAGEQKESSDAGGCQGQAEEKTQQQQDARR